MTQYIHEKAKEACQAEDMETKDKIQKMITIQQQLVLMKVEKTYVNRFTQKDNRYKNHAKDAGNLIVQGSLESLQNQIFYAVKEEEKSEE